MLVVKRKDLTIRTGGFRQKHMWVDEPGKSFGYQCEMGWVIRKITNICVNIQSVEMSRSCGLGTNSNIWIWLQMEASTDPPNWSILVLNHLNIADNHVDRYPSGEWIYFTDQIRPILGAPWSIQVLGKWEFPLSDTVSVDINACKHKHKYTSVHAYIYKL